MLFLRSLTIDNLPKTSTYMSAGTLLLQSLLMTLTCLVACHATDGPPRPSKAIFAAVGGPLRQCMAATDGLPRPFMVP